MANARESAPGPVELRQTGPAELRQTAPAELLVQLVAARARGLALAELDEGGVIRWCTPAFERLARRRLTGARVGDLVAPAQRESLEELLASGPEGVHERLLGFVPDARGVPRDFEVTLLRHEGGWLWMAEAADSTVAAVNQRLLEMTDALSRAQRRIDQQNADLRDRNDKLLELDQLKDALLANVSHDLRTPLTAILGYAELLRRRGGLGDKQAHAAEVIERNARRLLRMVNDLLLLAQARAGRLEFDFEAIDLARLALEAVELARPLAEHGQLGLVADVSPAGAIVEGDSLRLGQLLENLIGNAIKFTPPGGTVGVRVAAGDRAVILEVEDDGPGIEASEQSRLYEAFVRGGETAAPGSGLGLAIVREVAAAHGAQVQLSSQPAVGTRFTVTFTPAGRGAARQGPPTDAARRPPGPPAGSPRPA